MQPSGQHSIWKLTGLFASRLNSAFRQVITSVFDGVRYCQNWLGPQSSCSQFAAGTMPSEVSSGEMKVSRSFMRGRAVP